MDRIFDHVVTRVKRNSAALVALSSAVLLLPGAVSGLGPLLITAAPGVGFGLLYGVRNSVRYGTVLGVLVAGLALGMLSGKAGFGILTLQSTGIAAMLAAGSRRGWNGPGMATACFAFLAWTFLLSIFLMAGNDLKAWYSGFAEGLAREMESSLRRYGVLSGAANGMDQWLPRMKVNLLRLFPGFFGISLVALSFSNVLAAGIFTSRFWGKRAFGPSFKEWRMPDPLVWLVIFSGSLALFGHGVYGIAGENGLYVMAAFYFIQGLAVTNYLVNKLRMAWYVKWPFYILILVQWYGLLMIALLGLADVWFDFRSRIDRQASEEKY